MKIYIYVFTVKGVEKYIDDLKETEKTYKKTGRNYINGVCRCFIRKEEIGTDIGNFQITIPLIEDNDKKAVEIARKILNECLENAKKKYEFACNRCNNVLQNIETVVTCE